MKDIIIVGAGPAGLTASIFGVRAGLDVLVLEANAYGGQIINANRIDNYPANPHINGFDFATNLYNQALELGVEIKFEKVIDADIDGKIKKVITTNGEYETKTIIIAAGSHNRKIGLSKEDHYIGKGLSYCATCDGMFYKNKDVLVYGGGSPAIDSAMYLSDICNKVYLVCRENEVSEATELQEKGNIEILLNSKVVNLNGDDTLESVTIESNNETKDIMVSGIFVAIGQVPETNNLTSKLDTNEYGYIKSSENTHTNVEGVFVAGDIREKRLRQLVTAVSDGAMAATETIDYIRQ
jgi:thioredoxin reductase (NADPH)